MPLLLHVPNTTVSSYKFLIISCLLAEYSSSKSYLQSKRDGHAEIYDS